MSSHRGDELGGGGGAGGWSVSLVGGVITSVTEIARPDAAPSQVEAASASPTCSASATTAASASPSVCSAMRKVNSTLPAKLAVTAAKGAPASAATTWRIASNAAGVTSETLPARLRTALTANAAGGGEGDGGGGEGLGGGGEGGGGGGGEGLGGGGEGEGIGLASHLQGFGTKSHGHHGCPVAHGAQWSSVAQAALPGTAEHESHAEVQGVGPRGGDGEGGGDGAGGGDGGGLGLDCCCGGEGEGDMATPL